MVEVLKMLVPLRQGDLVEGIMILLNQCFANRNKEDKIYPLSIEEKIKLSSVGVCLCVMNSYLSVIYILNSSIIVNIILCAIWYDMFNYQ